MTQIILASGSSIRASLLRNAGVHFKVEVPRVDEKAIMQSLIAENAKPSDIADTLAEYKARRISQKHPTSTVIAADQVLSCNGDLYSKPRDIDEAREHLRLLRGQGHQLLSAVVIYEDLKPVWRFVGRAQLVMRDFSDEFLEAYISENAEDILQCVGCYQLESSGVNLFSKVQGDYFTILGLPLLEVLGYLRTKGLLQE